MDRFVQRGADGLRAVHGAVPVDTSFYESAQNARPKTVVPWLLLFGIFRIALLRCAMIAFVEVSSFGIGTSTMYLATVHPLLAVYVYRAVLYGRPIGKKKG